MATIRVEGKGSHDRDARNIPHERHDTVLATTVVEGGQYHPRQSHISCVALAAKEVVEAATAAGPRQRVDRTDHGRGPVSATQIRLRKGVVGTCLGRSRLWQARTRSEESENQLAVITLDRIWGNNRTRRNQEVGRTMVLEESRRAQARVRGAPTVFGYSALSSPLAANVFFSASPSCKAVQIRPLAKLCKCLPLRSLA